MRIWIHKGNSEIVLCDHGRGGPSNFIPQVVRNKAILPYVRSVFAEPIPMGNAFQQWSFLTRNESSNIAAAQMWLMELNSVIPYQADVFIELDGGGQRLLLAGAVLEFSPVSLSGVLARVGWTVTFGDWVYLPQWIGDSGPVIFFDGSGGVNADGYPIDGRDAPHPLDLLWNWPSEPSVGDYVFSALLGFPAWFDGVGWLSSSGMVVDGHSKPASSDDYTRPSNPPPGQMCFDAALQRPIWFGASGWIRANGSPI